MVQPILLGGCYLFLATWWLRRDRVVRGTGLSAGEITVLFMAKCLLALIYGYVGGPLYQYKFDTWQLFEESLRETDLLLSNPGEFVGSLFRNGYAEGISLQYWKTVNNFWSSFQVTVHYKIMGVWNLLSGRNYYVNTIFYSFFTFYGIVFFIRLVRLFYPEAKKLLFLSFLLMPGFLFWGNGMYKEGWIFTGVCAAVYGVERGGVQPKYCVLVVVALVLLAVTRTFSALLLAPLLLFYFLWKRTGWKGFPWALSGFLVLLCLLGYWWHVFNLPADLSARRAGFLLLKGDSLVDGRQMLPTWSGFFQLLPTNMVHVLLRPFPWEAFRKMAYLPAAAEVLLLEAVVLYWISKKGWRTEIPAPLQLLVVFAFFNLVVIGSTVPFLGAIVRYKSIYLPFLLVPIILSASGKTFNKKPGSGV